MGRGRPTGTARPATLPGTPLPIGCFNGCGESRPNFLRTYALVRDGKAWGYWRLCSECLVWGNPHDPRDGDPLAVLA